MKRFKIIMPLFLAMAMTTTAFSATLDTYTVQKDDTLWIISQKYKVSLDDIVEANKQFEDPNLIYPGDKVNIPGSTGENDATGEIGASMTGTGSASKSAKFASNASVKSAAKSNAQEKKVADLVNKERAKKGLAPLKLTADVSNCSRVKSEDMRNKKYFSHQSPTYGSPFDMLKSFGIKYKTAGENIAKGQKTPETVMKAWMNSEGHRKNIMNPKFKEIGVGYVTDKSGKTYWTQQFITR